MLAMKKGKLCRKVYQVNDSEKLQVLWPMKHYGKAGANILLLTLEL